MAKQMTMGVIVGNRGFFPSHLATSGRLEMIAALEAAGIKPIVLTPEETAHGAVETYEDAKKCAALFKKHAAEIDGIIITLPNFGEERGLADALRLANLQVPVLIQATPDHAGKMTIAFRRDSFCGKMSICNNLKQYGIPYSLTRLHTEAPDSAEFKADLEWFSACVPRRAWFEERAHRCDWCASDGVQHGSLLREAAGAVGHYGRDAGPERSHGPHRADEGQRRCCAGEAGGDQEIYSRRRHSRSCADEDGEARRGDRPLDEGE